MRPPLPSRFFSLLLVLGLTLTTVACDRQDAQEDPRGSLREAVAAFRDYEGVELVIGAQLDDAARASALTEGELSEEELALLTDSTLTVRGVGGEGEEDGETELLLVVSEEQVLSLRALGEEELYVLVDLPAIQRVVEDLDEEGEFAQAIDELEGVAGLMGLGDVLAAAKDGEWIHVTGLQELAEMAEAELGETEEPSPEDIEQLARRAGERLLAFIEDDDVDVTHVGRDDVGERIRLTASGPQLRDLLGDLLDAVDEVAALDPTGMGMGPDQLRAELEQGIGDDVEIAIDTWVDGGRLTQVAIDVFEVARSAGEEDVPDGELLVAIGIADFGGPVERPDVGASFDIFDAVGALFGGLDDLGDDPFADDEGVGDGTLDDDALEDVCLTDEEVEEILAAIEEDPDQLSDDEVEELLGVPLC